MNNQCKPVYKCRLCGEIIPSHIIVSEEEAVHALFAFEKGESIYKSPNIQGDIRMIGVHFCDSGGKAGLIDFQGFEIVR